MSFSEDAAENTAVFTLTAIPSLLEKKDAKRLTYSFETYTFKDLGNGYVEVTVALKRSPPYKVPLWIIQLAFPGAAADTLRKIVKLTKEG